MPTVLRHNGFEVVIRTQDHLPPHAHVFFSGDEVVIDLGLAGSFPVVRDRRGMPVRVERRALDLVTLNNEILLLEWTKIHG